MTPKLVPPEDFPEKPVSRGEARRAAFLEAVMQVFLEQGYEAASVNEVVRRAGGSLATLYSQYGNKDGLFSAVLEHGNSRFVEPMSQAADPDLPIEQGLQQIGETFLARIVSPDGLAFFRMVVGDGRKFPATLQQFLRTGPERVRLTVAAYLAARADQDGCVFEDAEEAAGYFCEMVRGRHQYRALSDASYALNETQISAYVTRAVRFFLAGARKR
ncbi:MAG: TetR/AcrR family transcriptional regulator C-terminal domain-containing protein [Hyphomonadaceae bacterium]